MNTETPKDQHTWTEEIEVMGHEAVDHVKKLVAEGNVRRLILRSPDGHALIEVPLTAGVAVGGVVTIMAPVLAAVGALAGFLAHVKIEVVRTGSPGGPGDGSGDGNAKASEQPPPPAISGQSS